MRPDTATPEPTIARLLSVASATPDAPALGTPDGAWSTHRELAAVVSGAAGALRARGVGPSDRVAIVTGGGPIAATTFLAASWAGAAAPLNPRLGPADLDFALEDLRPRLLLATGDAPRAVLDAADRAGVPVLDPAGRTPAGIDLVEGDTPPPPAPDDVALVLHTSGTTGRPKQVPLTHANLSASSAAVAATLRLSPDDRCLGVMPLFHIHGLVATVLASLRAGASVTCTPGFSAPEVLRWLRTSDATWYSAVPTMHQAILERAGRDGVRGIDLRMIRSSSASLAPATLVQLEGTFSCPVVEAYGMTEAAHQMTSNPLPPGERRPGTVGPPAGPDVRVLADDGTEAAVDQPGEVVIRGPGVTRGYLTGAGDPNADAFVDGWFRTGDQGRLDAEGYLTLTGRIRELINRAGESIAPREIDEVLLEDPSVAQAVAFAIPDERLGEAVAAAVVAAPGHDPDPEHLRRVVAARLAPFKVPDTVVVVDRIPMGPTGKLQRVGLADALGLAATRHDDVADRPYRAPSSPLEERLVALWSEILEVDRVGADDHFLDLGGDSLLATRLLNRVQAEVGDVPDLLAFHDAATVREQARVVMPR